MNAQTNITAAFDAQRLAKTAQEIVDAGTYDRFMDMAAQCYLDNLADGYCEPDELLEQLAEEQARDAHDELGGRRPYGGTALGSYHRDNWDEDLSYSEDFSEYFDNNNRPQFIASVRGAYSMECVG